MPKEIIDDLLLLYGSLSPSEKRYLRLRIHQETSEGLVMFLDLLFAHGDDELAFAQAAQDQFPDPRQRSRVRRQLFHLLLDGLEEYERSHSPDLKLHRIVQRCRVLLQRNMYGPADKMIRQGMKTALHYDRKWAIAVLAELKTTNQTLHKQSRERGTSGEAVFQESYFAARDYANCRFMVYQDAVLAWMFNQEGAIAQGNPSAFCEMRRQAESASRSPGFSLPCIAHHVLAQRALLVNDTKAMYDAWKEMEQLYAKYPQMVEGREQDYLRMLHFRTLMALTRRKPEEAIAVLEKLRIALPNRRSLRAFWYQMYYTTLGQLGQNLGDEKSLRAFVEGYPASLHLYRDQMEGVYLLLMNMLMAICHFMLGEYKEALRWVHQYLHNDQLRAARKSIQVLATLRLCIYVELGEWDTLEQMVVQTRALLAKHIVFPQFKVICDNFFASLLSDNQAAGQKRAFQGFVEECIGLFGRPEETNVIAHFDFLTWGKAKLVGKPMREFLQENYRL